MRNLITNKQHSIISGINSKKLFILAALFWGYVNVSFAQQPALAKYVIITFTDEYKITLHAKKSYYWIVPQDSIKSKDNLLSHLYLSDFSKSNLIDCCNGKEVDPFLVFNGQTRSDFDSLYYSNLDGLRKIVVGRRVKLQTITKKWQSGQKESIVIYATPVIGRFCSSNFHIIGQARWGYKGKVYIPYSSFSYIGEFWDTDLAKFILHQDFSKVKFDIIPE